ncbi:hypothetical protein QE152_g26087 [Popillia japonica]|uniref:Uncharacterized protein n=1 Tax=Popillia japonica TaxID=7064 RepID=A0AAW1JZ21_POPJA
MNAIQNRLGFIGMEAVSRAPFVFHVDEINEYEFNLDFYHVEIGIRLRTNKTSPKFHSGDNPHDNEHRYSGTRKYETN